MIEIGGPATIEQPLEAVKPEGAGIEIGQRSGQAGAKIGRVMLITDAFKYDCIIRRVMVGSREQFEEMNRSILVNRIRPAIC